MVQNSADDAQLTDLADGALVGPEWETWLADHPKDAAEVAIARQVQALLVALQTANIEASADFEARLMARLREDTTLLNLMNLGMDGIGGALLELLSVLFDLLPTPRPAAT